MYREVNKTNAQETQGGGDDGLNSPTNERIKKAATKMGGEMMHVTTGRM